MDSRGCIARLHGFHVFQGEMRFKAHADGEYGFDNRGNTFQGNRAFPDRFLGFRFRHCRSGCLQLFVGKENRKGKGGERMLSYSEAVIALLVIAGLAVLGTAVLKLSEPVPQVQALNSGSTVVENTPENFQQFVAAETSDKCATPQG